MTRTTACSLLTAALVFATPAVLPAQIGHVLNGVGAVNQGMAGVATATPLDASGTLHWNPAGITLLPRSEIQFSVELLNPDNQVSSSVPTPTGTMRGTTESDKGVSAIPSMGLVWHPDGDPWTFGFGAFGISGFGVDYPVDPSNPIFNPPPSTPGAFGGFGSVYSEFQMLQLAPTAALKVSDHLSLGFAPTIDQASLAVDPFCAAPPDDADGNGVPTYPSAAHAAKAWGFGGQFGILWHDDASGWKLGASYKTMQHFQDFDFNSQDEAGNPRRLTLDLDFPRIASVGVGWSGWEGLDVGLDVRYIDYSNTSGFGAATFRPDASVNGFGWDSIFVVALGAQYQLLDNLWLRGGYSYNENPISDANSTFNIAADGVIQHHLALGMSIAITDHAVFDVAYRHGYENSVEGPIAHPSMGAIPGSSIRNTLSTDSILMGFRVYF